MSIASSAVSALTTLKSCICRNFSSGRRTPWSSSTNRTSGTAGVVILWLIGRSGLPLQTDGDPFSGGRHNGGQHGRAGVDSFEKIRHLVALVDDVVAEKQTPFVHARKDHREEFLIVALPRVAEHEVERAGHLRNLRERIARNHLHDVR